MIESEHSFKINNNNKKNIISSKLRFNPGRLSI